MRITKICVCHGWKERNLYCNIWKVGDLSTFRASELSVRDKLWSMDTMKKFFKYISLKLGLFFSE